MRNVKCLLASAVILLAGDAAAERQAIADVVTLGTAAVVQDAVLVVDLVQGKGIYTRNCSACHDSGAAGAPKLGETSSWASRIAQGVEVMATHAIDGYQGKSGYMPAKGGFKSLTDQEVTAAVNFMASESR